MQEIIKPIRLSQLSEKPLVSVWMTNYNYADFLEDSISSVLNQTYSNFELIVCDDGSTDNSLEIIKRYINKDNRIKLIKKENAGIAAALNDIHKVSKGQIICFLDSDDYFSETKIEKVANDFIKNPNCGVHFHSMMRVNKHGEFEGRYPLLSKIPTGWLAEDVIKNSTGLLNIPPMSGISIRNELTEYIFPITNEVKTNVDGFIINTALLLSHACSNENELSYYRLHSSNLSNFSKRKGSIKELIRIKEKDIELNRMMYNSVNRWLKEKLDESIELNKIENNWFYLEANYVISLLSNNVLESDIKFWKTKLLSHRLTKNSQHIYYFYKNLNYLPKIFIKNILLLKYGQNKLKHFINKVYKNLNI